MKKFLLVLVAMCLTVTFGFAQNPDSTMMDEMEIMAAESMYGDFDDEESGMANYVPGLLHSSQDVYASASYNFSISYFKSRGLDSKYQTICMNGLTMANLVTGRAQWSQWGGLNHVIRYPESILNNNPATFTFGDIAGAGNYTLRASTFRQQLRATYSLSNRSYNNRIMLTYASGLLKNNWAFTASVSGRFGNGISYVDGTYYNGVSYFLSAEKRITEEHALSINVFGSYTDRATQGNATQEAYDLVGTNYYNPNWGYQNGEVRSSKIKKANEPVLLISHFFKPTDKKYTLITTLGATAGTTSSSALDWYDVSSPKPDYYRYLPSYQETDILKDYITDQWLNDVNVRQINWDKMYNVNQYNASLGERAQYILKDYITNNVQVAGSTNFVLQATKHLKLSAGADIRGFRQHNFERINDLLGGSFWLDNDKYAEGDNPENSDILYNDLDNKDKKLQEGDIFGYNYAFNIFKQTLWVMNKFSYDHLEFHVGAKVGASQYWRTGYMRNGLFPDDSKGKSKVLNFIDLGLKAGLTYKINGRNFLTLNSVVMSNAPEIKNCFLSPNTHNGLAATVQNEKHIAADFSYIMTYPVVKMRLSGYFTQFYDLSKLTTFYHDDYGAMVNYSMTNMNQRYMGVELGIDVSLGEMFSIFAAANVGDYRYTNNPNVVITADNGYDMVSEDNISTNQKCYLKDFHVAGSPQIAGTIALKFRHNYWWASINLNYFDGIYVDINPERRTTSARGTLSENSELYHKITDQSKCKGQFTLDASLSKSWKIKRCMFGFNLSVTNILNNKKLVTTAWEQYRFDYKTNNVDKYPIKYYYAFGTTFYAGINFTFN
ncbi:MAG: hypothetical protein MJZ76_07230 [Bacteroidales bacterium]|nr:hypothetical protein [Bacteroidales bacterium]